MSKEQQNDELVQMYRDLVEIFDEEYEKRRLITPQNTAEKMTAKGYRKQSENVIELPCKVGDTVYAFSGDFGVVLPYFVEYLRIGFMDKNRNYWIYEANCHAEETDELLDELDFDLEDIGKTVFLSSEEAERALKGGDS